MLALRTALRGAARRMLPALAVAVPAAVATHAAGAWRWVPTDDARLAAAEARMLEPVLNSPALAVRQALVVLPESRLRINTLLVRARGAERRAAVRAAADDAATAAAAAQALEADADRSSDESVETLIECVRARLSGVLMDRASRAAGMVSSRLPAAERDRLVAESNAPVRYVPTGKPVLVLVHGFGGGVGLWTRNLEALAQHYDVYAFDLVGFGRSSHPSFATASEDPHIDVINLFIDSIEQWRGALGIPSMHLLGHSFGGYLSARYALRYPQRIDRLILAAPFGVKPMLTPERLAELSKRSFFMRRMYAFMRRTSPQALLRVLGPFGPRVLRRLRGRYDRSRYDFADDRVIDYIFHLSAGPASGDYAFMKVLDELGGARDPLVNVIGGLTRPLTLIYGDADFITPDGGLLMANELRGLPIDMHVLPGSAHHMYATHPAEFHDAVLHSESTSPARSVFLVDLPPPSRVLDVMEAEEREAGTKLAGVISRM